MTLWVTICDILKLRALSGETENKLLHVSMTREKVSLNQAWDYDTLGPRV